LDLKTLRFRCNDDRDYIRLLEREYEKASNENKQIKAAYTDREGDIEYYINMLREIDSHIRSTSEPVPYIIRTLKNVLPEYNSEIDY
jgi:phosphoenolpyruvate synthase/pyruvate phosphate dikinase